MDAYKLLVHNYFTLLFQHAHDQELEINTGLLPFLPETSDIHLKVLRENVSNPAAVYRVVKSAVSEFITLDDSIQVSVSPRFLNAFSQMFSQILKVKLPKIQEIEIPSIERVQL